MQKKLIKAFSADFNSDLLGRPASPGLYAHAQAGDHIKWNKEMGVNTIYSFCMSLNGYAWYRSSLAPVTPGMKGDFLKEMVRLGHDQGMAVHGYFCLASNPWYTLRYPDEEVPFPPGDKRQNLPLTKKYLDYVCRCMEEASKANDIDGFLIDWFYEIEPTWCPAERKLYRELMGETFPGEDKIDGSLTLEFRRRAIARAWKQIREAVKSVRDSIIICVNVPFTPEKFSVFEGQAIMRECDWFLSESPELENACWVKNQVGDKPVLYNLTGWSGHDPRVWEKALKKGFHLFGYAKCDVVTTLPPETNPHIKIMRQIYNNLDE